MKLWHKIGWVLVALVLCVVVGFVWRFLMYERQQDTGTVVFFTDANVALHFRVPEARLRSTLKLDGLHEVASGDRVVAPIELAGMGTARFGVWIATVESDGVVIGTKVKARPDGVRNAIVQRDGKVILDSSIPWER